MRRSRSSCSAWASSAASELNYSSDVDLVYVYERDGEHPGGRTLREFFVRIGEEVTRALAEVTADGFCFRVDLRLRPGGGEGPLAVSLPALLSYYEACGQTWERAVWLKARAGGRRPARSARRSSTELDAVRLPALPRLRHARGPEGDEAAGGRVAPGSGRRASAT